MTRPTLPSVVLQEAGVAVLDCEHRTPDPAHGGYVYVAIPDLVEGRIDTSRARRISKADYESWTRRTSPKAGDVIVTRRGRVGDTAVVPAGLKCAIGQNLVILRSDGRNIDQRYLRWAVRSPLWWSEVGRLMNVGAVFSSLNVRDIARMQIPAPGIDEQRAIAHVLGALDDKIAANVRLLEAADSLSAVLFGSMTETEAKPLTSVAEFVNGRAFTKDASGTGRVVVRIAELNSGIGGSTVFSDADVPDRHLARPGDILFAWSGSLTLHRWFRPEAIVNQHIFKVIPRDGYPPWLIWGLLANGLPTFKAIAADKATTMGHIQRRHLEEPVAVPVRRVVEQRNEEMTALWDRALAAERENLTLAAVRDRLLPDLMSGRLRVRETETAAHE